MIASTRVLALLISPALLCVVAHAQQWQQTASSPRGSGITALAVKQSNGHLYATTGSFNWPTGDTGGVHRSSDGGSTWTRVYPANIGRTVVVKSNGIVFASVRPTTNEGLYYSTNDGQSWTLTLDVGPNNNVFAVAFDTVSFLTPNVAYAGTRSGFGVHRNTGGGIAGSWTTSSQGLPFGAWILALAVAPLPPPALYGMALAAVMNPFNPATSGVYFSTNQGQGWNFASGIQSGDTVVSLIVVRDSAVASAPGTPQHSVFAGTSNGKIYHAVITGVMVFNLVYFATANPEIAAFWGYFAGVSAYVLAAAYQNTAAYENTLAYDNGSSGGGGVLRSISNGTWGPWQDYSEGLPPIRKMSAIAGHTGGSAVTLYAGMFLNQNNGAPVYRRTVPITDVKEGSPQMPRDFALLQNYPNPFNPSTRIAYRVPSRAFVELRVFDVLDRAVATLVSEVKPPGSYEVTWDGTGFASGVYFYRLQAGAYVETKKLVLLK